MIAAASRSREAIASLIGGAARSQAAEIRGSVATNGYDRGLGSMEAQFLIRHFDRLVGAPGGIAKLRSLVLQLGVGGKLVPQFPSDDPISRRFKKSLPLKSSTRLPPNWESWRMLDLVSVQYGFAFESNRFSEGDDGIPLIRIRDIRNTSTSVNYTGKFDPDYLVNPGDYLVGMDGDFNIAEWRGPKALLNQRVCRFRDFAKALDPKFLFYSIQQHLVAIHAVTSFVTVKHLSAKNLNGIVLSLPPLAEQRRIVAKVEELMRLCDALEAAQREREGVRTRVRASALRRLTAADSEIRSSSFALRHLPKIACSSDDVVELKQIVRRVAMQGALVDQIGNEGSAVELIAEIDAAAKNKRKRSSSEHAAVDDAPFTIPRTWSWIRFGRLVDGADAGVSPSAENFPRTGEHWGVIKVSALSWDRFLPEENKQLLPDTDIPSEALIRTGDFLISRANTSELVAKAVVVEREPERLILSDKSVRLAITPLCDRRYICMVNNHADYARR